jgi:hypothetical protein
VSVRTGDEDKWRNDAKLCFCCSALCCLPPQCHREASGLLPFSFDVAYLLSLIGSFPSDRGRNDRQQSAKVQHINRP